MLSCTDFLMACGNTSLFAMTIYLFYLPYSYHDLLVAKYGCKKEKSQEAKWRSAKGQRPIHEMERAVDMDLFLEAQEQWAQDSLHRLVILHEMFLHVASQGQKKVECMCCRGHQGRVREPNPEEDQSALHLVGYHTS